MTSGVYAIENALDGRVYIGSSIDIEARWSRWRSVLSGAKGDGVNRPLSDAWLASGADAFSFRILEEVTPDRNSLSEAETRWIAQFGNRCYNILRVAFKSRAGRGEGPSLYTGVGEQIMLARRRAGMTQRDLGGKLGVSHVAVGDIERGKTKPNLDHLAAIADALGVPLSEIVVLERRQRPAGGREGDQP